MISASERQKEWNFVLKNCNNKKMDLQRQLTLVKSPFSTEQEGKSSSTAAEGYDAPTALSAQHAPTVDNNKLMFTGQGRPP